MVKIFDIFLMDKINSETLIDNVAINMPRDKTLKSCDKGNVKVIAKPFSGIIGIFTHAIGRII